MTPERKLLSRPGKASLAGRAPRREDTLHPQITPLRPRGPGGIPAGCLVFFFLFFYKLTSRCYVTMETQRIRNGRNNLECERQILRSHTPPDLKTSCRPLLSRPWDWCPHRQRGHGSADRTMSVLPFDFKEECKGSSGEQGRSCHT